MKKFGFTLAEVIVTLGIIGLLAAITAPLLGSLTPDQNKIKVLKAYKILSDVTIEILNDPSLYLKNSEGERLNYTEQPTHLDYLDSKYKGDNKFSYILASKLELNAEPSASGNDVTFTTIDGINWVTSPVTESGVNITIDLDEPESGEDKTYDEFTEGSKPKPDRFSFEVDLRGNVRGGDSLTKAYLANPNKLNDKKADYAKAEELKDASTPES